MTANLLYLKMVLITLALTMLSASSLGASWIEKREIGDDIGYCECVCQDMRGEELCDQIVTSDVGPQNLKYFKGRCEYWEKTFIELSISDCSGIHGEECQGFKDTFLGWKEGATGHYRCYWSEL